MARVRKSASKYTVHFSQQSGDWVGRVLDLTPLTAEDLALGKDRLVALSPSAGAETLEQARHEVRIMIAAVTMEDGEFYEGELVEEFGDPPK